MDVRALSQLVDAIAVLMTFGYSDHQPASIEALEDVPVLRETSFRLLAEGQIEFLIQRLAFSYRETKGNAFPPRPIDLLGWFSPVFEVTHPLYPQLLEMMRQAMEDVLMVPITDICRMEYAPLAPLSKTVGVPVDAILDFFRLENDEEAYREHPTGWLIRHDAVPRVHAMVKGMRS